MIERLSQRSRFVILVIVVTLSVVKIGHADLDLGFAQQDGGHAGAFLDYGASARSLGMGRAHVAMAEDASAVYWNPAGFARLDRKNIVSLYSLLYEDTGFGFFSYAQPTVDVGTFGVGLVTLRSQNFEKRSKSNESLGNFSTAQTGFLFSHGFAVGSRWAFGSTLKVVRQEIDSIASTGYGLDLGSTYRLTPRFDLGVSARNLLPPRIKLRSESDRYPRDLRAGARWAASPKLMLAADIAQSENRGSKLHLGGEYRFSQLLALRGGLNETELSAGLGFQFGEWGLDYAFGYHDAVKNATDLGLSHRLGVHVSFGSKVAEQASSLRWQKKGKVALESLQKLMDQKGMTPEQAEKAVAAAKQVIRHQGYLNPQDLYMAQGYIYYFQREFERSVQSLGEALVLSPGSERLANHLEKARAEMTEERTREIVSFELRRVKDLYEKGDFAEAMKGCDKILSFRPDDVEAAAYLEDAKKRLREPVDRQMKIAKTKSDRGEHLDAIKALQIVKEMDPNNKEATDLMSASIAALERQAHGAMNEGGTTQVFEVHDAGKSRDFYSQGLKLYSQGKLKEAASAWEQAVRFDGSNSLARNAYHRAVAELKDKNEK